LTVRSLAGADPEKDIAPLLSSVLFGNAKAKQIVRASRDVLSKFGGRVPETVSGLREITGIGPTLAGILVIVNRRCTFHPEVERKV
jgi:endonuclease III